jgi:hypothetical protein
MSFATHGIAGQSTELGKAVLALSALGLFTKLLHIDLSKLQVLGVTLQPASAGLIPGFIGLALIYVFVAFCVARLEAAIEQQIKEESVEARKKVANSKPLMAFVVLSLPFSVFVYSMPYAMGALGIALLWSDSMSVITSIWLLAFK